MRFAETVAAVIALTLFGARSLDAQAAPSGEGLYRDHCAICHDGGYDRAPPKAVLATHSPAEIEASLRSGVMAEMGKALNAAEISAIAAYLGKPAAVAAPAPDEAPNCTAKPSALRPSRADWNGWSASPVQARFQPTPGLRASDVPRLKLKWAMGYKGGENGQATVVGGRVFLSATSGVYSLDAASGCLLWRFATEGRARSTVVVGPLPAASAPARYAAYFTDSTRQAYAIDAETGALLWKSRVDDRPVVTMTGSPTLFDGRLYVPISSGEEYFAQSDSFECCKFRGAVAALDAVSGKLEWKTAVWPGEAQPTRRNAKGVQMFGPAGGAIWSSPTADARRKLIYVGTGDSYTDTPLPTADSVVALDARTGAVRWTTRLAEGDNYIMGCELGAKRANCPTPLGPDHDIGASPILRTLANGRQLLLVGQKSSQVYALDPDAGGKIVWSRRISPGGPLGGVEWGIAADGDTLFAPVSDIFMGPAGRPSLNAFRIADGTPIWSVPSPSVSCAWHTPFCSPALSQAPSAMPGVVFSGAMNGHFRAYETASGKPIWDYDTGGSVTTVSGAAASGGVLDAAGPTIAGGLVLVSSGYQGRSGRPGSVLLAFSVDGR